MPETSISPEVREFLGPDRLGQARDALVYSLWFLCPGCRVWVNSEIEANEAVVYVHWHLPATTSRLDGEVRQWAVLRAHGTCAEPTIRPWGNPTGLPWPTEAESPSFAVDGPSPAPLFWWATAGRHDLPVLVLQQQSADLVFEVTDLGDVMHDNFMDELAVLGAGNGIHLGALNEQGPHFARHLAGWSADLYEGGGLWIQAPRLPGAAPTTQGLRWAIPGPSPAFWIDAARRSGHVALIAVPPGTIEAATFGGLDDPRLHWLSSLQGGLHGGLIPLIIDAAAESGTALPPGP